MLSLMKNMHPIKHRKKSKILSIVPVRTLARHNLNVKRIKGFVKHILKMTGLLTDP